MITSLKGAPTKTLGLAAYPDQDPDVVRRARDRGINCFFFYGPSHRTFIDALVPVIRQDREQVIVATGSGARQRKSLLAARRTILSALRTEMIDLFFAEYIHPGDDPAAIFGEGGVLDELQRWKANGWIRMVGATAHDRPLAAQLAADPRVDVLMHRFNMAHCKAITEVFPAAAKSQTPVVAFTATRWGTLLKPPPQWPHPAATAADCYRYCLSQPAVSLILTAPKTIAELDANLTVLDLPRMNVADCDHWERYGNIVYGAGNDDFEMQWP